MNGMQFQEPQRSKLQQQNTRTIKKNEINPILKTTSNFVDKIQEYAVPLNKGKK